MSIITSNYKRDQLLTSSTGNMNIPNTSFLILFSLLHEVNVVDVDIVMDVDVDIVDVDDVVDVVVDIVMDFDPHIVIVVDVVVDIVMDFDPHIVIDVVVDVIITIVVFNVIIVDFILSLFSCCCKYIILFNFIIIDHHIAVWRVYSYTKECLVLMMSFDVIGIPAHIAVLSDRICVCINDNERANYTITLYSMRDKSMSTYSYSL